MAFIMTLISNQPAMAGFFGDSASSPEQPLRPPSAAKILQAIQKLDHWEVRRQRGDPSLVSACGPDIDSLALIPLPPTSGTSMDYARKIIAQAVVMKAEALTPDMIEQIGANVQPEHPEWRDNMILEACKAHIRADVMAIAQHGMAGRTGPHALLNYLGVEYLEVEAPACDSASALLPESSSPTSARTPIRTTTALSGSNTADRPALLTTPPKSELLGVLKLAQSSSLGLSVKLAAPFPLKLELVPGQGFGTRFAHALRGQHKGKNVTTERAEAYALVLRTLVDVVANADIAGLRAWLPSIDAGLILDPLRCGEVLMAYQSELFRRTREVIESSGHLGLKNFPALAYYGFDLNDL